MVSPALFITICLCCFAAGVAIGLLVQQATEIDRHNKRILSDIDAENALGDEPYLAADVRQRLNDGDGA